MTKEELQEENNEMRAYIETLEAKINTYEKSTQRKVPVVNIDKVDYELRGSLRTQKGAIVTAQEVSQNTAKYESLLRELLAKQSNLLVKIDEPETQK